MRRRGHVTKSFRRLFKGLRSAATAPAVWAVASVALALIFIAATFYWIVEGWSFVDAIYFSVVTLATVGYGDLSPKTVPGKLFTVVYIFAGLGIFVSAVTAVAQAIQSDD